MHSIPLLQLVLCTYHVEQQTVFKMLRKAEESQIKQVLKIVLIVSCT